MDGAPGKLGAFFVSRARVRAPGGQEQGTGVRDQERGSGIGDRGSGNGDQGSGLDT